MLWSTTIDIQLLLVSYTVKRCICALTESAVRFSQSANTALNDPIENEIHRIEIILNMITKIVSVYGISYDFSSLSKSHVISITRCIDREIMTFEFR